MPQAAEKERKEVEKSLEQSHPSWSEKKVESTSYAIVQKQYEKEGKQAPFWNENFSNSL